MKGTVDTDVQAVTRLCTSQAALACCAHAFLLDHLVREAAALADAVRAEVLAADGRTVLAAHVFDRVADARMAVDPRAFRHETPVAVPDHAYGTLVIVCEEPPDELVASLLEVLCTTAAIRLSGMASVVAYRQTIEQLRAEGAGAPASQTDEDVLVRVLARAQFGVVSVVRHGHVWAVSGVNPALLAMRGMSAHTPGGPLHETLGLAQPIDPVELESATTSEPSVRRLTRVDGSPFDAWVFCLPVEITGPDEYAVVVLDVEFQSRRLRELERMAMTDPVTGLANRTRVTELLERCLRDDPAGSVAVMLLDLDRFKNVNDSLGHHVGDQLLIEVARRLRLHVPDGTLVARLGGDEFLLVLRGLTDVLDNHQVAYALLEELGSPFELPSGHRVATSVSIGVATAVEGGEKASELIRKADLAMYRSKDLGRNRYAVCDATMLAAADERLERELVLRRGLEEDRLSLRLQPIVDLRTGELAEFEALVRLHDPELGEVSPDAFVPIAEETGLIAQIDHWVLEACLALFAQDPRLAMDPSIRVAVNISGRTLERPDFMSRLVVALHQHDVEASRLVIEITESCLLGDNRAILWTLNQLRARGALVAIDDFGTGYSALSYLQNFDVDLLKIDQSFVGRVSAGDERGTKLVGNIVRLAHDLGLRVVAEGVELDEQERLLTELGCDLAQGWLYGRPGHPQIPEQPTGR